MLEPPTDPARLRRLGLRATAPRLAVLAMLAEVGGHQSADELVAALRQAGYPHARTTVYNALQDLARAGLVREAPVGAGALRYEADTSAHHHFVCRNCGLIINVPVPDAGHLPPAPPIDGVEVDTIDIIYRGTCVRCEEAGAGNGGRSIDLTAHEGDEAERAPAGAPGRPAGEPAGAGSRGNP